MSDKARGGRGVDDRDVTAKTRTTKGVVAHYNERLSSSYDADRLGREAQRRTKAYARARGQL